MSNILNTKNLKLGFSVFTRITNNPAVFLNISNAANRVYKYFLHQSTIRLQEMDKPKRTWEFPITEETVERAIKTLTPEEKNILKNRLLKVPPASNTTPTGKADLKNVPLGTKETVKFVIFTAMPYVVFGFIDNFSMIIFGDLIDTYINPYQLSMLTNAALGNTISDAISLLLTVYIASVALYLSGIATPKMTEEQMKSSFVGRHSGLIKSAGIVVGCLLGMWPLLFIH